MPYTKRKRFQPETNTGAGPRVGALVSRDGTVIVTVLKGERTAPRLVVVADNASREAVERAAKLVASRVERSALIPVSLRFDLPPVA